MDKKNYMMVVRETHFSAAVLLLLLQHVLTSGGMETPAMAPPITASNMVEVEVVTPATSLLMEVMDDADVIVGKSLDEDSAPLPPPGLGSPPPLMVEEASPETMSTSPSTTMMSDNVVNVWDWQRVPVPVPPRDRMLAFNEMFPPPRRRPRVRQAAAAMAPPGEDTRRSLQVGLGAQVGVDVDYDELYDRIFSGGSRNRNKDNNNGGGGGYGTQSSGGGSGGGYRGGGGKGKGQGGGGGKPGGFNPFGGGESEYSGYLRNRERNMKRFLRKMRRMMSGMSKTFQRMMPRLRGSRRRPKQQQKGQRGQRGRPNRPSNQYQQPQQQSSGYSTPQQQSSGYNAPQQQSSSYGAPQTAPASQGYSPPVTTTQQTLVVSPPLTPITPTASFQYAVPAVSTGNSYSPPSGAATIFRQNVVSSSPPVYVSNNAFVPATTQSTFVPITSGYQTSNAAPSPTYTVVTTSANPFVGSSYSVPTVATPTNTCFNCNNNIAKPGPTYTVSNVASRPSGTYKKVVSTPSNTYTATNSVVSRPSSSYTTTNVVSRPSSSYGSSSAATKTVSRPSGSTYTVTNSSPPSPSYSSGGNVPPRHTRQTVAAEFRQQKQRDLQEMKAAWQNYMSKLRAYKRRYNEDEALRKFRKEVAAAVRQRRRSPPTSLADAIDKVFHEVESPRLVHEEDIGNEDLRAGNSNVYPVRQKEDHNESQTADGEEEDVEEEKEHSFPQSLHRLTGIKAVPLGSPPHPPPSSRPVVVGKGIPPRGAEISSLANYPREIEQILSVATAPPPPSAAAATEAVSTTPNPFAVGAFVENSAPAHRYVQRRRPKSSFHSIINEVREQGKKEGVEISEVREPFDALAESISKYRNILTPKLYGDRK